MAGIYKDFTKKLILAKNETTEGTDAVPTPAADAFRVLNYTPTFMTGDFRQRVLEKAYFGADPGAMANLRRGATFDMEWAGGGTAITVPPWMKMLRWCGFAAPVTGASSSTVKPQTDLLASATFLSYLDDLELRAIGARGSVGFTFEDDAFPVFNFNMLGRPPVALAAQVVPGAATITGYIDPVLASTDNSTFTYDGFAAPLRRVTMSDNAQLELRSLINPVDRILYRGRAWSGTIVIEVGDLTVKNYFTGIREGTGKVANITHGSVAGNIVQADMPALVVSGDVTLSEEQGRTMATIPVTALPVVGNDEIVFTSK